MKDKVQGTWNKPLHRVHESGERLHNDHAPISIDRLDGCICNPFRRGANDIRRQFMFRNIRL
jgi:hypothetical protein